MDKKEIKKNIGGARTGFSVAEMLVSISIIALVSAAVFANFRHYEQRGALNMAAQKLASDIRQVQGFALGLKEYQPSGGFPGGGWGLRFHRDEDNYIAFADVDLDQVFDDDGSEIYRQADFAASGVKILGRLLVTKGGVTADRNYAFIVFEPPEPKIYINSSANASPPPFQDQDAEQLEIVLELEGTSLTKNIVINSFGLVDISD